MARKSNLLQIVKRAGNTGVADSSKTLELGYSKFNFEKPYEPVYIEAECHAIKSDSLVVSADFDSTLVVTKLIKITREIPDGPCNQ